MKRIALCLFALSAGLHAADAPAPVPAGGDAAESAPAAVPDVLGHSGVVYQFSLSNWSIFNGSPLAYTPFELGYDFGNGLRLQTGVDLFFYEGLQDDVKVAPGLLKRYSYEMQDWRSSAIYRVPLSARLRPIVGVALDAVGGQRKLSPDFSGPGGTDVNAKASKIPAWGFLGASACLGLEYLLSPRWALNFSGRYTMTFSTVEAPIITQFGLLATF